MLILLYIAQTNEITSQQQAEILPIPTAVKQVEPAVSTTPVKKVQEPPQSDLESQLLSSGMPSKRSLMSEAKLSHRAQRLKPDETGSEVMDHKTAEQSKREGLSESKLKTLPADQPQADIKQPTAVTPLVPRNELPAPKVVSQQPTVADQSEEAIDETIPLVWELPQAQRDELQQLKISIHVYHKEPARRFVLINMRRYGEGDKLRGTDYQLKHIERDGVVVDYGDGLVRLLRERHY
jgi:hypothetical protein